MDSLMSTTYNNHYPFSFNVYIEPVGLCSDNTVGNHNFTNAVMMRYVSTKDGVYAFQDPGLDYDS